MARRFVELDGHGKALQPGHGRELAGLVLCGLSMFCLVALASHSQAQVGGETRNLCGILGDRVAFAFHLLFGSASLALVSFLAIWGALLMARRGSEGILVRLGGILVFTATLALYLSLHLDLERPLAEATNRAPYGPGGNLGSFLGPRVRLAFGPLGARILLGLLGLISLLLATDFLTLFRQRSGAEAAAGLLAAGVRAGRVVLRLLAKAWAWFAEWWQSEELPAPVPSEAPVPPAPLPEPKKPEPVPAQPPEPVKLEPVKPEPARREPVKPAPLPAKAPALRPRPAAPKARGPQGESRGKYELPPLSLLREIPPPVASSPAHLDGMSRVIEKKLSSFKIEARVVGVSQGPAVTLFELTLAEGVRVNQITAREDDLAMALAARSLRVVAPIPGKGTVGVEVPNPVREPVVLKDLVQRISRTDNKRALPVCLGKDVMGESILSDLAEMPHLLIAGATGSGKSVCVNAILASLLLTRTPAEVGFILVDPKTVELQGYRDLPHLMTPVVVEMPKVPGVLQWAVDEMERRYALLARSGVRNLKTYNKLGEKALRQAMGEWFDAGEKPTPRHLPYVVIVIDEFGELMATSSKDVEGLVMRLAQKSRAVGIHVVMATQHPSREVVTGIIKANLPTRISFKVTSSIYSRVVLDQMGADRLLGEGDMLYLAPGTSSLRRAQGVYVGDDEIEALVEFWKNQAEPEYVPDLVNARPVGGGGEGEDADRGEQYYEAVRLVLGEKRGAATMLQRALKIGYTRASRYIELMEEDGLVGRHVGSKSREVLMSLEDWEALQQKRRDWLDRKAPRPESA